MSRIHGNLLGGQPWDANAAEGLWGVLSWQSSRWLPGELRRSQGPGLQDVGRCAHQALLRCCAAALLCDQGSEPGCLNAGVSSPLLSSVSLTLVVCCWVLSHSYPQCLLTFFLLVFPLDFKNCTSLSFFILIPKIFKEKSVYLIVYFVFGKQSKTETCRQVDLV